MALHIAVRSWSGSCIGIRNRDVMVTIIMTAAVMTIISNDASISSSTNCVRASSNNLHGSGSCNGSDHCYSKFVVL